MRSCKSTKVWNKITVLCQNCKQNVKSTLQCIVTMDPSICILVLSVQCFIKSSHRSVHRVSFMLYLPFGDKHLGYIVFSHCSLAFSLKFKYYSSFLQIWLFSLRKFFLLQIWLVSWNSDSNQDLCIPLPLRQSGSSPLFDQIWIALSWQPNPTGIV